MKYFVSQKMKSDKMFPFSDIFLWHPLNLLVEVSVASRSPEGLFWLPLLKSEFYNVTEEIFPPPPPRLVAMHLPIYDNQTLIIWVSIKQRVYLTDVDFGKKFSTLLQ